MPDAPEKEMFGGAGRTFVLALLCIVCATFLLYHAIITEVTFSGIVESALYVYGGKTVGGPLAQAIVSAITAKKAQLPAPTTPAAPVGG